MGEPASRNASTNLDGVFCNSPKLLYLFLTGILQWGVLASVLLWLRPVAGYLGLAVVFVWVGTLRGGLVAVFQGFFASIGKILSLAWGLGAGVAHGH